MIYDNELYNLLEQIRKFPSSDLSDDHLVHINRSKMDQFCRSCIFQVVNVIALSMAMPELKPESESSYQQAQIRLREALMWIEDAINLQSKEHHQ